MTRHPDWRGLALAACAVVLYGCSAGTSSHLADGAGRKGGAGLRLVPDPPFASSSIAAALDDPREDLAKCRFEWRRNGTAILDANSRELAPDQFARGDRISVSVLLPDGKTNLTSAEVRVANSPKISRVSLMPTTTVTGVELQANVESADPDGGTPTLEYRWFRNGTRMADANGASVPVSAVGRSDRIAVEVVASDGDLASSPVRSDAVDLDNHPPQLSSRPASPRGGDSAYHYQVVAADPDGDALRYELVGAPAGMTIDAQGALDWTLPPRAQRAGEYTIGIRVSDGKGGESTQNFTLRLDMPPPRN